MVNERVGAEVLFKCENFQKGGAFKFRGSCNTVLQLSDEQAKRGVATHSSGNHGQAIALAAQIRGIDAYIVMPQNAPEVKKRAIQGYGAQIILCEATTPAREAALEKVVEETGATFVHPYNQPAIIAGQGTCAMEFLMECPGLDAMLVPIGGGGLISGTSIATKHISPDTKVIGCEPALADDAYRSFKSGSLQPVVRYDSIADGLRTSLGELSFKCIQKHVDDIVTVTEEEIVEAMRFIWERMNIIIETSSAVPVAALFNGKVKVNAKSKIGIILSGGNIDLDSLPWNE